MTISFDKALGIHPTALQLRAERGSVLAENLANADTPNYKARDIDFKAVLEGTARRQLRMKSTAEGHMSLPTGTASTATLYRVPLHPSLDENTVTAHLEKAEFAENSLRYQASLMFLNRKLSGLRSAMSNE